MLQPGKEICFVQHCWVLRKELSTEGCHFLSKKEPFTGLETGKKSWLKERKVSWRNTGQVGGPILETAI